MCPIQSGGTRDPAAHAALNDSDGVAHLLRTLREAGADEQAAALVGRLPSAGLFDLFCQQQDRRDRFWFGQETDGRPAESWDWDNLDL